VISLNSLLPYWLNAQSDANGILYLILFCKPALLGIIYLASAVQQTSSHIYNPCGHWNVPNACCQPNSEGRQCAPSRPLKSLRLHAVLPGSYKFKYAYKCQILKSNECWHLFQVTSEIFEWFLRWKYHTSNWPLECETSSSEERILLRRPNTATFKEVKTLRLQHVCSDPLEG